MRRCHTGVLGCSVDSYRTRPIGMDLTTRAPQPPSYDGRVHHQTDIVSSANNGRDSSCLRHDPSAEGYGRHAIPIVHVRNTISRLRLTPIDFLFEKEISASVRPQYALISAHSASDRSLFRPSKGKPRSRSAYKERQQSFLRNCKKVIRWSRQLYNDKSGRSSRVELLGLSRSFMTYA